MSDESLHAHEITEMDARLLHALRGATFGPESGLVLPSGRRIDATEANRWTHETDPDYTGDPELDRMMFRARTKEHARAAERASYVPPRRRPTYDDDLAALPYMLGALGVLSALGIVAALIFG